jgi:hypothetical protein
MFLIPTGVDTDDTHSDDLPIPKVNKEDKPFFNAPQFKIFVDNNKVNNYTNSKEAINKIRETYILSKKMESDIIDLFVDAGKQ